MSKVEAEITERKLGLFGFFIKPAPECTRFCDNPQKQGWNKKYMLDISPGNR